MRTPKRRNLDKAKRKYKRLESRGARGRVLRRLSTKIEKLYDNYVKRLTEYAIKQKKKVTDAQDKDE